MVKMTVDGIAFYCETAKEAVATLKCLASRRGMRLRRWQRPAWVYGMLPQRHDIARCFIGAPSFMESA